jgi:Spy/CpxP family protein refolding chaperone
MKNRIPIITTSLIGAGLLAVATFVSVGQNNLAAQPDPAHAAHLAAAASQSGGQTVEAQLAEILARLERLEANTQQQYGQQQQFAQQQHGQSPAAGAMPMGAGNSPRMKQMPGMGSGTKPMQGGMAGMGGGPAVTDQLAELRFKMQRLEATIQQQSASSSGAMPMSGRRGMGSGTSPMQRGMAGMGGDPAVADQMAEMLARIQQLEAITQQQPGQSPAAGAMPMGAGNPPRIRPMPGMGSGAKPMQGGMAGMGGDPAVADQLAELRGKMQRLEATIQQQFGSSSGAMPMSGTPGIGSGTSPMQGGMAGMSGMGAGNSPFGGALGALKPAGGMGGMGGAASPPGGEMGMMSMRDKMMGGMGGGAPAAGAPMGGTAPGGGMGMMQSEMGAMPAGAPASGMSGGGGMMGMEQMEMAGMMGGSSMAMPSALPGFPGASHLYHCGATGFFLDHQQYITLSTEQQMRLNQIKQQAALDKASASRSVQEAEQDLWTLTAADQPDNAQIEAKVAEIEKLKGDARLRFIGAIGNAATILTDQQRKALTGFAPPASVSPAAAPMAGGMNGM